MVTATKLTILLLKQRLRLVCLGWGFCSFGVVMMGIDGDYQTINRRNYGDVEYERCYPLLGTSLK